MVWRLGLPNGSRATVGATVIWSHIYIQTYPLSLLFSLLPSLSPCKANPDESQAYLFWGYLHHDSLPFFSASLLGTTLVSEGLKSNRVSLVLGNSQGHCGPALKTVDGVQMYLWRETERTSRRTGLSPAERGSRQGERGGS